MWYLDLLPLLRVDVCVWSKTCVLTDNESKAAILKCIMTGFECVMLHKLTENMIFFCNYKNLLKMWFIYKYWQEFTQRELHLNKYSSMCYVFLDSFTEKYNQCVHSYIDKVLMYTCADNYVRSEFIFNWKLCFFRVSAGYLTF